ncbi:protein kinase domain-containing protein [Nocardioides abyssi]|uniref:Translation initiation factor IF-2 N-terminal domain-containing protein n=1 Tax=Nocardioides abyssi TaxID=3058370 RepID=A0ABT8EYW8_9ACTN|nr:translation initiation factor IF-2 N-terminal domain-containing protein [Nocardioides abyssi]MDN4163390.1 translation initiation factor IF-2 N-terminal domain-containing protein [Nocardioides abyssi]
MSLDIQLLDPVEFLQPNRRLFIDTNIFMDPDTRRAGGLKRLFERGQDAILKNGNPIVVPTKVIGELTKQSRRDPAREAEERTKVAIKKAGASLRFLEDASKHGLVRKNLGDESNPYADDLFLRIFERFASTYEMCLLTRDITIKLRIRLLAHELDRRLLTGVLTKDGDVEIESDQSLINRGVRKYNLHASNVAEGNGNQRDKSEVAALGPLLQQFRKAFGVQESDDKVGSTAAKLTAPQGLSVGSPKAKPFSSAAAIKPRDTPLTVSSLPVEGDQVRWESASKCGTFVLGSLLGRGGEGSVYEGGGNTVVKIFDKDHITQHRKAKVELLVISGLQAKGLCIPSATVHNAAGEFVGYVMPTASGREARTIFNIRKLEKDFPTWKKSDLVDICISFLKKVEYLHSMNVILGDINPKNLMIDDRKNVFIIDADSWQLEGYPCPVGTPMYTSPAMLGKTYAEDLRTMEDELFAVATMLFQIVMTGQFPYMRTGTDGDMVQLIREGNFAFQISIRGKEYNDRDQPDGDWKYIWSHIHKPVKNLFWDTFHKEGKRYNRRPTATEWLEAFKAYRAYLGNKRLNFDPMSNDVRPIRNKAFKPDTPIEDCSTCGRKHAIAGFMPEGETEYIVPRQCNKCRGPSATGAGQARSRRPPSEPSRGPVATATGKTRVSALAKHYGITSKQALEKLSALGEYAKTASSSVGPDVVNRFEAAYGANLRAARRQRANTLDPSKLCTRCRNPFITYGNVEWHQREGKPVPTTHKAGPGGAYPPDCVPRSSQPRRSTSQRSSTTGNNPATKSTQKSQKPQKQQQKKKKKGFWSWLFG